MFPLLTQRPLLLADLTAPSPLGPWEYRGLFAPAGSRTFNSQVFKGLQVAGPKGTTTTVFIGTRWCNPYPEDTPPPPAVCPPTCVCKPPFRNTTSIWLPLHFDSDNSVAELKWVDQWTLPVGSAQLKTDDLQEPGDFLGGARDLIHDSERKLVLTVGSKGAFSVVDVANAQPVLVSTIAPSSIQDAHGLTFDFQRKWAFVASVATASVLCIDTSDAARLKVLSTIQNSTALYYSTHLSYEASRSALFVCSAGNGAEPGAAEPPPGHSISSIAVAADGTMTLLHRMTSWAPDAGGIPGKHLAYPVFTLLDPDRPLLYVSNDARCTVEVIDDRVRTLQPKKVGNYTSCDQIEYNSQTAYDPATKRLLTAAQHANSFAVFDLSNPGHPVLTSLLQDRNRTSCRYGGCTQAQVFAGATGVAFDSDRNLAFVASEYAKSFAVVDLSGSQGIAAKVVGVVRHDQLSGEAIQYDRERQRAFVVSRQASALLVVDVADRNEPKVIGVLSSKGGRAT